MDGPRPSWWRTGSLSRGWSAPSAEGWANGARPAGHAVRPPGGSPTWWRRRWPGRSARDAGWRWWPETAPWPCLAGSAPSFGSRRIRMAGGGEAVAGFGAEAGSGAVEAVGLDIGGTKIAGFRVTADGVVFSGVGGVARRVGGGWAAAIGVGVAGIVEFAAGVVRYGPNLPFRDL